VAYTDYQQRALYGAGQSAARAGQRFHMEREALERGDKAAAKYHRRRANDLNREGAYAAVRGMGGEKGRNQYFPVQSSGQPIQAGSGIALSSAGRDIFDQFRDAGFVEPIRQKKRYAPNTEPTGIGSFFEKALGNTLFGRIASNILPKKAPEPDDAYYKSLWGKGLNEMYSPSSVFRSGKFLGEPNLDPYYTGESKAPLDALSYKYGIADLVPDDIKNEEINAINEIVNSGEGIFYGGRGELPENYNDRWEKYQLFLNDPSSYPQYGDFGQIETGEGIPKVRNEMDEFMSGNIGILNPLQPDDIFEESQTIDITDGEEEIITETVENNPWIMRIFGNDVKGLRGYLWDLGVLNPNSDMYKKTDQLEIPE
jgi:hypothetical protein